MDTGETGQIPTVENVPTQEAKDVIVSLPSIGGDSPVSPVRPTMPPLLAGFLRGLAQAVILAVITFALANITNIVPTSAEAYVPIIILTLRTVEGLIDNTTNTKP